jgi:8-oxo-dGTP pyrophosphatase MutT (NUDIX family)
MFEKFLTRFYQRLKEQLPGNAIQYLMAPAIRQPLPNDMLKGMNPKPSGVLILIYPHDNELFTVLEQRPSYTGPHSGQISLPGGKRETFDKTIVDTALREANEEIGINLDEIELIGSLSDLYIPPSNFCVSPAVAYSYKRPAFKIEPSEVVSLIEVPLKILTDKNIVKSKVMTLSGGFVIETPYYDIDSNVVWGATAMILSEFIYILNELQLDEIQ